MRRTSFEDTNCSIARTLEVIGERWTLLIIRAGLVGVTRVSELQSRLGIARNILVSRLDYLIDHGVMTRVAYQKQPVRYDYTFTEKGRDLWLVLMACHPAPQRAPRFQPASASR